jgi:hypothetical protein
MNNKVIHAIYQMHRQSPVDTALENKIKYRLCSQVREAGGIRDTDIPRLNGVIRWLLFMLVDSVRSGRAVPVVIPRGHEHYRGKQFGYRIVKRVLNAFRAEALLSLKVPPPSQYGGNATQALASRPFLNAYKGNLIRWVRNMGDRSCLEIRLTDKDEFLITRFTKPVPINPETEKWSSNLRVINDFNQTVPIFLFEDDQTIKGILRDSCVTFNETRYIRSFCRGRLDCGGRFYNTWWQLIPSKFRSSISIDRQPVVEFDFSAMAIRLLYARIGLESPQDPYDLDLPTRNPEKARKILKRFVLAITNDKNAKFRLKQDEYRTLGVNHKTLVKILSQRHPRISDFFFCDAGVELQFWDSKIAEQIMLEGVQQGIVILSVHDSFIAQQQHEEALKEIMQKVYEKEVGYTPVIRKETPKRSPQINLPQSQSHYARFFHETYLAEEIASGRRIPSPGGLGDWVAVEHG